MIVYKLTNDSDFFWNDGVNFPHRSYIDSLSWSRNVSDNVNMKDSLEIVEIISNSPTSYFRVRIDNRDIFYMTKSFKVSQSNYIHLCEIDYWGSYLCRSSNFLSTQLNFIRQPSLTNLRWWDYEDPILNKYKSSKKTYAMKVFNGREIRGDGKINPSYYAVFLVNANDFNKSNVLGGVYKVSMERNNPITNKTYIIFKKIITKSDSFLLIPMTKIAVADYNNETIEVPANNHPYTTRIAMKLFNSVDYVSELWNTPAWSPKFIGVFLGPPVGSIKLGEYVFKSNNRGESIRYEHSAQAPYGNDNFLCKLISLSEIVNLEYIEFATPNIADNYLLQAMDFELNGGTVPLQYLNSIFTPNVCKPSNMSLTFSNRFSLFGDIEYSNFPIRFPYQSPSASSSFSSYLASNTNTLDTGLKANLAGGVLSGLSSLGLLVGSIGTANPLGVIGGVSGLASGITSTITGISQKLGGVKDQRTGASNTLEGVIGESDKTILLANRLYAQKNPPNGGGIVSTWNYYTNEEMQTLLRIIREYGYYGLIRSSFNATYNTSATCLFYQIAEDETLKNFIIGDNFYNNVNFKLWMKNTLTGGIRVWKSKPS